MTKLRLGVIGTGAFTEACHVPGLQSHPGAEVVALCGRDLARTRALAERLHVPDVCTDYHELCARKDLDAITIATPNACHAAQAQAAFAAGKHVFCEKPLGVTVREVGEMVRGAEGSHKVHQVAFTYRYLYGVQELKRRVLQGDVGVPYYVRVKHESWEGLHPDARVGFREKLNLGGGGVLYDVGSHLFDVVRFVLGPIQSILGDMTLVPRKRIDPKTGALASVETDDIVSAWFCCKEGVQGHLFASRATPSSGDRAFVEVIGPEGALKASLSRGSVDVLSLSRPARPAWEGIPLPKEASDGQAHCLPRMMRSFVNACLHGKLDEPVDASFYDGLAVQQAIEAVQEASRKQAWIRLAGDDGFHSSADPSLLRYPSV